jgi:tetratricopeptide (TPR) repeat protein/predicted Ser/Thr protein kinase
VTSSSRGASGRLRAPELPPEVTAALADPARTIRHYAILGELGRGGMGVVYRAFDTSLHRAVAIKMILDPTRAGEEQVGRFAREASAAARLRHPGIVSVYETGVHDGKPYLVMELVDGQSLESLLRKEPLAPRRIAEIVRDVARALEHAHAAGVVHRDVKPENVVIDREGRAKLMDFGLARDATGGERMTVTGTILGTPAYMSPEQADGIPERQGPLSDVYSTGAMLYRALVGRPVFEAPSLQSLIRMVLSEEPVAPRHVKPDVHVDLETITLRCLSKDPAKRYASAGALADELQRFLDGQPIVARPVGAGERLARWVHRNKAIALLGALLAVALVAAGAIAFSFWRNEARRKDEEARKAAEDARKAAARAEAQEQVSLARSLSGHGDGDGAIAAATKAIELDPQLAEAYQIRGEQKNAKVPPSKNPRDHTPEDKAWLAGAIDDFTRAHELDATDTRSLYFRGISHIKLGDYDATIADETAALALDPRHAAAYLYRADARRHKKDLDGASADLASHLEHDRDKARALANLEFPPRRHVAVAAITSYLSMHPDHAEAWRTRGDLDKGDAAIDAYSRALALDAKLAPVVVPKLVPLLRSRADARSRKAGEAAAALADYSRALELDPRNGGALLGRGELELKQNDLAAAHADLEKAVEIEPQNATAWTGLAEVWRKRDDLDRAIEAADKALEIKPKELRAARILAGALEKKGERARAIAAYDRVIELAPKDEAALRSRGLLKKAAGDRDGAIDDLAKALELAPRDREARAALNELRGGRRPRRPAATHRLGRAGMRATG